MKQMTNEFSEQSTIASLLRLIQRTSLVVIFGILFGIPGLVVLYVFAPSATGFYLIAMTATIAHVELKALNTDDRLEVDEDISQLNGWEAVIFTSVLVLTAAAGITMKLLTATGLALIAFHIGQDAILAITLAIVVPILDRELADEKWYLSIGGLSGIGTMLLIGSALAAAGTIDRVSRDSLRNTSDRLLV